MLPGKTRKKFDYRFANRITVAIRRLVHTRALFPGSSVVEQPAVNRLVAGSNPARGATSFSKRIESYELPRLGEVAAVRIAERFPSWASWPCFRPDVSVIAPHDEMIRANGESIALTGMEVKKRNCRRPMVLGDRRRGSRSHAVRAR
jgi:hypothetical protein